MPSHLYSNLQEMKYLHFKFYERSLQYFKNNVAVNPTTIHIINILMYKNQQDMNNLIYLLFLEACTQVNHKNCLSIIHHLNPI